MVIVSMWRGRYVQSFSSDDTVNMAPASAAHNDVFHQHEPADVSAATPRVFLSDTHRDVTNDVTLDDVIAAPRDDDDDYVVMERQRTVIVDNDNDDNMAATVARQPETGDDVKIDDVIQPMNGNDDVILIPEAMIEGS